MIKNVVLIGASAGGLEPLQKIVDALPDKLKNTSLIIAQHTSPNYESMLVQLLEKNTSLKVMEAKNSMGLEANTIYTCPPDTNISLKQGKFNFSKPNIIGPKPSVDMLFESAAKTFGESTVGIVISGTGHDGSKGIIAVKKAGGFTMAQDPETAKYPGMPESAMLTDMVDLVLSPERIGQEIPKLLDPSYREMLLRENQVEFEQVEQMETVQKILSLLHQKTGTDFSGYKASTIHRRLEKRINDKKYTSVEDYIMDIEDNPGELDNLFLYLLIGVTQFFRNPESMEVLKEALKVSLSEHPKDTSFRVWVPGCATGEEAYTIAMILDNLIQEGSPEPNGIQIFATDIDQKPLNKARKGRYPKNSLNSLPESYKKSYFTYYEGHYNISPTLKKNILFSKHDLTSNPPFLKLDLVSCRNLLIYFKTPLQNQILPLFHYTLNPKGLLFLGKSESIGRFKNLFETLDVKNKLFRRKEADARVAHIPILQPLQRPRTEKTNENLLNETLTVPDLVKETFYNTFVHPYIVVDESLNILEINKDVSFYLTIQNGPPNFTAAKLIHKDLRLDLRTLVAKALKSLSAATGTFRKIKRDSDERIVRLKVQPLLYSKPNAPFFIVIFEAAEQGTEVVLTAESNAEGGDSLLIAEMEHELASTREHLNTLIEELETSNEELQSLNEELQSSNEELQASNEELETSNEELQATNEELNIAYTDLREASNRIEEQTNKIKLSENNLKSVLDNTQQGFILINADYQVILFNKYAFHLYKEIFNVTLTENVNYIDILPADYLPSFKSKFVDALKGKQSQSDEIIKGVRSHIRHLSYNYTPVEGNTKSIDKVTVSFIDITEKVQFQKRLEVAYKRSEEERKLWKAIFDRTPEPVAIVSGKDYLISYCNKSCRKAFNQKRLLNKNIADVLGPKRREDIISVLDKVRSSGRTIHQKEVAVRSDPVQRRYYNITFLPVYEKDEPLPNVVAHAVDVSPQVKQREKIEQEKLFMKLISENIPEHVWVVLPDGKVQFMNQAALDFYGIKSINSLKTIINKVHPDDMEQLKENLDKALKEKKNFRMEYRPRNYDGDYCWHKLQVKPMLDHDGELLRLVASSTDINEQKITQKNKDDFIGVASHELKTPLTSVKAYVQLLQEHMENGKDPVMADYLQKTGRSVQKLEQFVGDLLDVTRIQNGKLTLQKTKFDLTELVEEVIQGVEITSKSHKILLNSSKEVVVNADRGRVEQVLINLLSNAIKFSPKAEEVVVEISPKIETVEVSVKDFGMGIPKESQEEVFDRFYRVSENRKQPSGMGIGLNISQEIINLHQGKLWVESTPKKGSIFYFTLPYNIDGNNK